MRLPGLLIWLALSALLLGVVSIVTAAPSPAWAEMGQYNPPLPETVLWNQPLSVVDQNAYASQEFTDVPNYSSFLADDFVNSSSWLIDSIFIPGRLWQGATDLNLATTLTWQIYDDNAGVPDGSPSGGNLPLWTLSLPPGDSQVTITSGWGGYPSNVTLNVTTSITLPPGHWWLVFYPTMSFNSFGQYGRQPADTANGYKGKFINPGGGFGWGTAWQDWAVLGPSQSDIAFRLQGTAEAGQEYIYLPLVTRNH